ncbi:MAG TPA: class I SAM-dependent methyltransferase [Conexibacter sp.]|jgi:SAM-dependent methyltransferase
MDASELAAMLDYSDHHWWYRGRRRVLAAVIDAIPLPPGARLLDAGCGSGRELDELAARGRVSGVDVSAVAVDCARARGHADVQRAAIERMPFADSTFDLVTCLDVIEHTPDDRESLAELRRVTRPGGLLVVTVPAYPSLWSAHDVRNRHFRRYRAASLRAAAAESGWSVLRDTHFNALLLPPAAVVRLARRRRAGADNSERDGDAATGPAPSELAITPRALDALLELPLRAEAGIIGGGRRIGAGLSLLAVMART